MQNKQLAEDTKKKLANADAATKRRITEVIEDQISRHKERVFRMKYVEKRRWLPVIARDLKGIGNASKMTEALLKKTQFLASKPNTRAGHLFAELHERLESKDFQEAQKIHQQLKNIRFPEKYLSTIGEKVAALELQARREERLRKMRQAYSGYTMEDVIAEEKELARLQKEKERQSLLATASNEDAKPAPKPEKQ